MITLYFYVYKVLIIIKYTLIIEIIKTSNTEIA